MSLMRSSDADLGAEDRFVADHDGVDVAVVAARSSAELDFALVAVLVLVDPGADRDLEAELGGDRRHQFGAAGRGIEADGAGVRCERLEVGADLLRGRPFAGHRDGTKLDKRGVGNAGKLPGNREPSLAFVAKPTGRHARTLRARARQRRCASNFNQRGEQSDQPGPEPAPGSTGWRKKEANFRAAD